MPARPKASVAPSGTRPAAAITAPRRSPLIAPRPTSSATSWRTTGPGIAAPSERLIAASTTHQPAPATAPARSPRPPPAAILLARMWRSAPSVPRPEAPDDAEPGTPVAAVGDDRHPDAEQAPEQRLHARVVEGVEV